MIVAAARRLEANVTVSMTASSNLRLVVTVTVTILAFIPAPAVSAMACCNAVWALVVVNTVGSVRSSTIVPATDVPAPALGVVVVVVTVVAPQVVSAEQQQLMPLFSNNHVQSLYFVRYSALQPQVV